MQSNHSSRAHRYDITTPLAKCLHIVYAAKKASETAPGVGIDTDLCFITDGQIQALSQEDIDKLAEIYEKVTNPRQKEIDQAEKLLEEMTKTAETVDTSDTGKEPNGR